MLYFSLALTAVLIDAAFGYPKIVLRWIGHPVTWMGALISWCDTHWNKSSLSDVSRSALGAAALSLVTGIAALIAWGHHTLVDWVLPPSHEHLTPALILLALVAATLIAQRSLYEHVNDVATALETTFAQVGREAVSRIVGRDTSDMDEAQISRAAIESLAENFADGVVAPVFWLVIAGLPGIAAYKAINTADSMIGHLNDRHRAFGFVAAKLDDIANFIPARIAAILIVVAAAINPKATGSRSWRTMLQFASKHRSPNAGWPEAAMGGALGIALAGPRSYSGKLIEEPWLGEGRTTATSADIKDALKLYRTGCIIQALGLMLLLATTEIIHVV